MNPGIGFLGTLALMLGPVGLLFVGEPDPSATHTDERPPNPPAYRTYHSAIVAEDQPEGVWVLPAPEPAPTATVAPHRGILSEAEVRILAVDAGMANVDAAVAVARCESSLNPGAVGGAGELGLWQIHPIHFDYIRATFGPDVDITDPVVNAWYAARLSAGGTDWSHWSCRP